MKSLFILLLTVIFVGSNGIFAQDAVHDFMKNREKRIITLEAKNAFYFELAGNAIVISLNYERFIKKNMSIRVGFGTAAIYSISTPLMFNFFVGENYRLELGIGATFFFHKNKLIYDYVYEDDNMIMATAIVGYRYQPFEGGFVFKIGFTPFYVFSSNINDEGFLPSFGISLGNAF